MTRGYLTGKRLRTPARKFHAYVKMSDKGVDIVVCLKVQKIFLDGRNTDKNRSNRFNFISFGVKQKYNSLQIAPQITEQDIFVLLSKLKI